MTHGSTTDPDARLLRKGNGKESRLCFISHALMENRNGLVVQADASHATSTAERDMALQLIGQHRKARHKGKRRKGKRLAQRRITLGADKLYDAQAFVTELKSRNVTPHIAIAAYNLIRIPKLLKPAT